MSPIENLLIQVKNELDNMWYLVLSQLENSRIAFTKFDKDLAREIISKEKRVNATELKIDRDCENIFALYSPVAIDLRFLLAVLKINNNLERIGDIAEGMAKYVISAEKPFSKELLDVSQILPMYHESINILSDAQTAFNAEDTILARKMFKKDEFLDEINIKATSSIATFIKDHIEEVEPALWILSMIRKLERVGDQAKNIAEETIFYLDAKVVKHELKNKKAQI